jgi:rhamnosyltransferase
VSGATAASAIRPEPCAVSVVIPTLNGGARFQAVLEALAGQDVEGGLQLVVVDSGSGDGTTEAAEAAGAKLLRIPQEEFNHGATRNLGIAASSGQLVALLTQDALPMDESYVRLLLEPYENPRIDGVYARQFPRRDCDPLLSERLRRWSAARGERELKVFAPGDAARSREIFEELPPMERYLSCAFDNVASSLRRASWERTPLPERSFGEDVAWARDILLGGGSIAFEPSARVEHSHRIRMGREFRRLYCDHRNLNELFELVNVPSWAEVFRGWRYQRRFYAELLEGLELSAASRLSWRAYAMPYALLETAAQFLGARSLWKCDESRFWAWADRRIRTGV